MYIYYFYIVFSFVLFYATSKQVAIFSSEKSKIYYRTPNITLFILGSSLVLVFSLRDITVGTDIVQYYEHYLYDELPDWRFGLLAGEELLFRYLEVGCNMIGMHWQVFLSLTSVLIITPIIVFFKRYSENLWASLLIYMTIGLFAMNMSGIRQSIAISIVLIATIELYEGRLFNFFIFVIVGAGFHYSALFAFSLAFIRFVRFKNNKQLTILLLLPVLARVAGDAFFSQLSSFMPMRYDNYDDLGATINPILEIMHFCILFFCYISLMINKRVGRLDFFLYFIVVLYVSAIELSHTVYMAGRLAYYFEMPVAVAIPNFIHKFRDSSTRQILAVIIYGLCLTAFIIASYGSDTLGYNDYKFFWE